jgi:alpha-N-arabinofuranosidase
LVLMVNNGQGPAFRFLGRYSTMSSGTAKVTVVTDESYGTISPRLHGHFAEHLGRCVYDGLWVGPDSDIPNEGGWRSDVVAALKAMTIPLLRWPGGCFADSYHWRDGIGPADKRPRTFAESCGETVVETNGAGTHEFIHLCRLIGAEPYLAGNVGSGTVQELADWVHYCNGTVDTALVQERTANGHADSMNVRLWGVGNENWACGGNYDAATYARDFRRYTTFVKQMDGSVEAVACGGDPKWNELFLKTLQENNTLGLVNHLSLHRYWSAGKAIGFTEEEYYQTLRGGELVEGDILNAKELIARATEGKRKIGIALDEWGIWHPEANVPNKFEAPSTQRDAVAAAGVFDVLHRWCADVSMANIAQIVNVLHAPVQTKGKAMWKTPTYHAFALYAAHQGGQSLRVDLEGIPTHTPAELDRKHWSDLTGTAELSLVNASASRNAAGGLVVSLTNRHIREPLAITLSFSGSVPSGVAKRGMLAADSPESANSAEQPDNVNVRWSEIDLEAGEITLTLPAASVQTLLIG